MPHTITSITTASLTLRPLTLADARALFTLSQERGIRDWLPDQVYADEAHALDVVRSLIAHARASDPRSAPVVLGVCLTLGGTLIGHAGLSQARGAVEIGYAIEEVYQGRGLATEAVRALTKWGLETFALGSIDGIVATGNAASCKVLERAGFSLVDETERMLHGVVRSVRTYRACR